MPLSSCTLRHRLVVWLYAIALAHLLGSIVFTWAGFSGWLDDYLLIIERAFGTQAAPAAARAQQVWWMALFGATLQSYSLFMLALVHLGSRLKSTIAWGSLIAGLLLWAPQDILISVRAGVWSHVWLDAAVLIALLPPLFWLYRHDKRALADDKSKGLRDV
ncbi:cell division protein [Pseudomonas sp. CDFA 602]|uniref:cell division protein n=1 Tax=Pseudomonas californiensis TaxID=2829823 RepID=UPI001E4EC60A|nr:cell division protein [Pseudomonas californiensis]MCD5997279.1 cell division protein [Pseudomonas californiensis]MCD6002880.1 cell division protein [Pseudomonas californiensis]